jgi:hypothetical protein
VDENHHFHSDCRTKDGITIGLIDSLIFISRVLSKRDLRSPEVLEALKDLQTDEDLKYLLSEEVT